MRAIAVLPRCFAAPLVRGGLLVLAASACDVPPDEKPVADAAAADAAVACDPEQVTPFPAGTPVWSAAELEACEGSCPSGSVACFSERCPSRAEHVACVADSLDACLSQVGGRCREQWALYVCCSVDACDTALDDEQLTACVQSECASDLDAYALCADAAHADPQEACLASAESACLL